MDETADEKSSAGAAAAARQYSGTMGGIALCQVAVTVTYAIGRGHTLIDGALYMPEACAADEERGQLAGVPEEVMFASKPQLVGALLERAHSRGIRAAFVTSDEVYGSRWLRCGVRQRGMGYVMAVRASAESDIVTGGYRSIWFGRRGLVDSTDRDLLALLQQDATQSYAALGRAVGLSAGAAH